MTVPLIVVEEDGQDEVKPPRTQDNDDEKTISPLLLNLFVEENGKGIMVHEVLDQLKRNGIKPFADIRLEEMMNKLSVDPEGLTISSLIGVKKTVSAEEFKEASRSCALLLNKTLGSKLIIPDFQEFRGEIEKIWEDLKTVRGGKNADYIPQLSRVNPNYLGISVCTVDGQRCSFGDTGIPFCIQSCSMALNYAINVSEHGPEFVHKYLGKEPSGVGYSQIGLDKNGLPHNPMINAGAISCCSVMKKDDRIADRFDFAAEEYKKMAGEEFIGFNNATFLSEKAEADRNFAIGYYLKEHGVFPDNTSLISTLDLYFQLCSVEATTDSASVISATLANGGVCPTTKVECVTADAVRNTLSLMYSCGIYDYSGEWAFEVGIPAKSGVAGCIFIVVPGLMGICVWSPPLDELGNSYRGILFAKKLIEKFAFHQFDTVLENANKIDPRLKHRMETKEMQINNMLGAASNNDMVLLMRYFGLGVDFNMPDYDNRTALHLAASNGHLNVVKFLVQRGKVDVNFLDRWQGTALDDAIREEYEDVCKYLKNKGCQRGEDLLQKAMRHF